MSDGLACRISDDTTSAGFHADVRGLYAALGHPSEPPPSSGHGDASEPPPSSGRSEVITQPYADAYADTMASPTAPVADDPSWCVDTGGLMHTMTTFELWEALERGDVLAWMRVWREGMECWTPVGEIPELACAIAGTPAPPLEPEALPDAEAPTGPLHTPSPSLADSGTPPPASAIRPITAPARLRLHGARWLALGSAVAIAAVISALFVHQHAPAPPPAPPSGAANVEETALRAPQPAADDAPAPEAVTRHDERGQHRLPRSGRRAYGR